jgi:hypothetical protein
VELELDDVRKRIEQANTAYCQYLQWFYRERKVRQLRKQREDLLVPSVGAMALRRLAGKDFSDLREQFRRSKRRGFLIPVPPSPESPEGLKKLYSMIAEVLAGE